MSQRPVPIHDRLAALDPVRAVRQTRLIAALNARRLGDRTLAARLALARDRRAASAWIRFRAGTGQVAIAPLLVGGELVRLSDAGRAPDIAVAARLLGEIEPLVVALEYALSVDLHPEGLTAAVPDDAILLRLDASGHGQAIGHRLIVAVPATGEVTASALPAADSALFAALRVRWTATIDTPPIPAAHLRTIVAGDLYLLGLAPLVARITLPGHRRPATGRLEPTKGSLTLQDDIVPVSAGPIAADAAVLAAPIDWTQVKVPATIEVDGGLLSARELAALAPGSVLPVPRTGGTLPVRVLAGGTAIGAGELVAVGDGFGVLFTSTQGSAGDDDAG